jgi:hypothetical protein
LKIKREKQLITKLKETQLKSFKNNKTHQQKLKGITQKMFNFCKNTKPTLKIKGKTNKKKATIQEIKTNPFEIIKKQENPFYQNQN